MYCPNCKQEYDGKFCPECGTKLIEKPTNASGISLNLGDANAISGGLHVNDSHAVHNEDKSIHNISNTTSNVTNITQVSAQKTEIELLQERKTQFLNACKRAYEDNVLEQREVVELEELRIKMGLDKTTADNILESVRVMSDRNARKSELNPIAKTKLKILTSNLQKNEVKALMDQIDSLEPLVRRYDHDELSRKYYLVLAALKPEKCIEQKERTKTDTYWEAFWSYLAYIKAGRLIDAEETLASLDHFSSYPEDNMTVLAAAGALMMGDKAEAKEYLDAVNGDFTPALQRFVDSIYLLLEPKTAKDMGADEDTCAFYLVNFFGQKDPKAKAEEERLMREVAEAERKRKEMEEQKRREEESRKKAEEEPAKKRKSRLNLAAVLSAYKELQEDIVSSYLKGDSFYNGKGVVKDYKEAVKWYRKAAEQGYAKAQNALGDCYYNGEGVDADDTEAVKWYRKAAEQGFAAAQYNLGDSYFNGEGVERDYTEAIKWYRKAAEQGYAIAQNDLGVCYFEGKGGVEDYFEAVKWFRKAAEQGLDTAQYSLANCYRRGIGVLKDQSLAKEWYKKAAEQGHLRAQDELNELI